MMEVPASIAAAVLLKTCPNSVNATSTLPQVSGYDFNQGINYHALLQTYKTTGFQATNFGLAVDEINAMVGEPIQTVYIF